MVPTTNQDRAHQALGQAECLRLLGSVEIGRLGYTRSALPVIRPVSFRLREGRLFIPCRTGSPLLAAVRGAIVAFEADDYDAVGSTGWTVSVVGPSHVVEPDDGADYATLRQHLCLITVHMSVVQGWRTTVPDLVPAP